MNNRVTEDSSRQSRERHTSTSTSVTVPIVHSTLPPTPNKALPPPVTMLGGEGLGSRRPWKQQCFDKRGEGRLLCVTTERSWVAVTRPTPTPPEDRCILSEKCCNRFEPCIMPNFVLGCFVRCRPCGKDVYGSDSPLQSPASGQPLKARATH
ncbi:hypothetical protein cyc_08030 [Cyclospora cayetanensis]|uniref:Uncharacterized protein n=1 Tax=Cyclospora cayetanensis TaxID=88456 RepID=A0A1D3D2J8_9EIME|nr:hypothetical protein cyc_08030 [Cyclospora cayetanensis]